MGKIAISMKTENGRGRVVLLSNRAIQKTLLAYLKQRDIRFPASKGRHEVLPTLDQ